MKEQNRNRITSGLVVLFLAVCAFAAEKKVWTFGDSNTHGSGACSQSCSQEGWDSYRTQFEYLMEYATADDYVFVGTKLDCDSVDYHDGQIGRTASNGAEVVWEKLTALKAASDVPDVIIVMLGTNDIDACAIPPNLTNVLADITTILTSIDQWYEDSAAVTPDVLVGNVPPVRAACDTLPNTKRRFYRSANYFGYYCATYWEPLENINVYGVDIYGEIGHWLAGYPTGYVWASGPNGWFHFNSDGYYFIGNAFARSLINEDSYDMYLPGGDLDYWPDTVWSTGAVSPVDTCPPGEDVVLIAPADDDILYIGDATTIKWDLFEGYIEIRVSVDLGDSWHLITASAINAEETDQYQWTVPATLGGGSTVSQDVLVRIEDYADSQNYDQNGPMEIRAP